MRFAIFGAGEEPPPRADAVTEETSVAPPGFLAALGRRLTWRRVPAGGHGSSDGMVLLCALVGLAVWLAFDRYAAGPTPRLWPAGVTGIAWFAAGLMALAFVLHRVSRPASAFRELLAAMVAGVPLPLAVVLAVRHWAPEAVRDPACGALGVAAALYVWRSVARAGGARPLPAMVAAGLFTLAFAWGTESAFVDPSLWYAAPPDEEGGAASWEAAERLLVEQPDRIDAAAARLRRGTAGRPDVFFLGFAGVGEEKVFAEEIQLSARVVSARYGAAGRTLLLVNDRRDRERFPLATVHGLRRALGRMAEHMDSDEDVLFLMLTSHGSDDPSLSVSNGAWPLEELGAAGLRTALDEARIKWRVVVISACHSGAFVGPLADENTMVLTSAAADRTSFGCSDEREITDFGAAFVRDALPQAPTLLGAFDQAKRAIAEREKREGRLASLPQAQIGRAIRSYWERVEAER